MEQRAFDIRAFDRETREVSGVAVPWNQTIDIGGFKERFARGAIAGVDDVLLFWSHKEPIGRVVRGEDTEDGYVITAAISQTARGEEAYTLLKDGVIKKFSVGFLPVVDGMEGKTVIRQKVDLKEVSLVPFPAYAGATISEVRSETQNTKEDINMSNEENVNDSDLRESVADLERRFAVLSEGGSKTAEPAFAYRSGGEWLKAIVDGKQEARDFGTTVEGDVIRPEWVSKALRRKEQERNVINLFDKGVLPAAGMKIQYPYIKTDTGAVALQVAEGDTLAYLETALDTAEADVKTYGGYVEMSRQVYERADLAYYESALDLLVQSYAKATNDAVRTAVTGAAGTSTVAALAADTAAGWLALISDAAAAVEQNTPNLRADFALASADVWKRLATMVGSDNRPVFNVYGAGFNNIGSADVLSGALNVGGLRVVRDAALANNTFIAASSGAVKVYEESGAPFGLSDVNVTALKVTYALYGYLGVTIPWAKGIVKADVDLV